MAWSSDWAPGGKAGPTQGGSGACNAAEWLEGLEPGSSPYLRVGSGGEGFLLEILAYLRPSKGMCISSFVSASMAAAFGLILICSSLWLCHSSIIAMFSITLWHHETHIPSFMLYVQSHESYALCLNPKWNRGGISSSFISTIPIFLCLLLQWALHFR